MRELEMELWVPGRPRPQGSARWIKSRTTGKAVPIKPRGEVEHRQLVAVTLRQGWGRPPLDGPVEVQATFCFARPKSHYGTGRNSSTLKPGAADAHTQPPDLDKLARLVGDALVEGGVVSDDSVIVSWVLSKVWVERGQVEGTRVLVRGSSSAWSAAIERHPAGRGRK